MFAQLQTELKQVIATLRREAEMTDEQIAGSFPTMIMIATIPEEMFNSPMVQEILKNLQK